MAGQKVVDHNLRSALEEIREELVSLIRIAEKTRNDGEAVLRAAGVNPRNVNSPHVYEAEEVKSVAEKLLELANGEYTWHLPDIPKLVPVSEGLK